MKHWRTLPKAVAEYARLLRHFGPELQSVRGRIVGALGILITGTLLQLIEPWPLKFVIDCVAESVGGTASTTTGNISSTILLTAAAVYLVVVVLRSTADYYEAIAFATIGNHVVSRIRSRLYRHLQMLPLSFHNQSRKGDLLVRLVGDVRLLRDVAVTAVLPLLGGLLVLVGMLTVLLILQWQLALAALAALPLFAVLTMRTGSKIRTAARAQRQRESKVAAMAAEAMSSMHLVKTLSLEHQFEEGFVRGDDGSVREEVKTRKLAARLTQTTELVIALATSVVLCYGGHLALRGDISPGDLVIFMTYLKRGLRPLQDMAKYAARLAKATAAGERIVELLEQPTDENDRPDAIDTPPLQGQIEFVDATFGYEGRRHLLHDMNLQIAPGECVAIVGRSGSGKSTLLNLLARFYSLKSGLLLLDGVDADRYRAASIRAQMSIVLQDTVLFADDVWSNIRFGALEASRDQIEAAAKLAGAHDFISRLPQGYDTQLGERGVNLSHGQRQRIAIARAMVRNAPLLLLDEPTTALDPHHRQAIREALRRLAHDRTTLLVTHDLAEAQLADRIVVIDEGQIVEQGTHDELLQHAGTYAEMYRHHLGLPEELADVRP